MPELQNLYIHLLSLQDLFFHFLLRPKLLQIGPGTLLKQSKHNQQCQLSIKHFPQVLNPLQVEIHCGESFNDQIYIFFEDEMKMSIKYRGEKFFESILTRVNQLEYF